MEPSELVYWADGAGSQAVFNSLRDVLRELCSVAVSDRAIALYQPRSDHEGFRVLSDSAGGEHDLATMANEPVAVNRSLDLSRPTSLTGLVVRSRLRPHTVGLSSGISIPWADPFGHGVLVVGVQEPHRLPGVLELIRAATDGGRLPRVLDASRMTGTLALQGRTREALRDVLHSDQYGRLNSIVTATQHLFGADTAYLALPDDGHSERYYFASLANVTTPQFRQLRMGFGQGLGGLARTQGRTVRTHRYAVDDRLLAAPVDETANEGIQSAMAAPLVRGGSVEGVLYVGSRRLHPYSETDERILEEFADYVAMLFGEPSFDRAVSQAHSSRVREEFAHAIHDSVVRSLVQIGFTAEQAAVAASSSPAKSSIQSIQHVAQDALATLREELSGLVDEATGPEVPVSQVLEAITQVPLRTDVVRNVYVTAADAGRRLPARIGETLIHLGTEALTNSMLHSGCSTEQVHLAVTDDSVQLTISDNGCGSAALASGAQTSAGHFGVASMYRRAAAAGGTLAISSELDHGTTVAVEIARAW